MMDDDNWYEVSDKSKFSYQEPLEEDGDEVESKDKLFVARSNAIEVDEESSNDDFSRKARIIDRESQVSNFHLIFRF